MTERTIASAVWKGTPYVVSQEFDVNLPGVPDSWYEYVGNYGLTPGNHGGLDIAMDAGTELFAAQPGEVVQAGSSDSFRPFPVWIKEEDGDVAIYGHMRSNTVKVGDKVKAGQKIGESGAQTYRGTTTPDGSGDHLHFELRRPIAGVGPVDRFGLFGYKIVNPEEELTGAVSSAGSGNGTGAGPVSGFVADLLPFGVAGTIVVLAGAVVAAIAAIGAVSGG